MNISVSDSVLIVLAVAIVCSVALFQGRFHLRGRHRESEIDVDARKESSELSE
jgi:hypothetical protein